jgi:hypothetical protein
MANPVVNRFALMEFREFIALLFVGAPALYSFEAFFTSLNEALKVQDAVNWRVSAPLALVFMTLNIRFINGNYEHLRSPQWKNPKLGDTSFSYVVDLCFVFLMHGLLVILATRSFILDTGLPVGVSDIPAGKFYCPGFFASVIALLVIDVAWLLYRMLIYKGLESTQQAAKRRRGINYYLYRLFHSLSGAFSDKMALWAIINMLTLFIFFVTAIVVGRQIGNENPTPKLLHIILTDHTYTGPRGGWFFWLLVLGFVSACMFDLRGTSLGTRGEVMLSRTTSYVQFMKDCAGLADKAQQFYASSGGHFSGDLPIGWRVVYREGKRDLYPQLDQQGNLTATVREAFEKWAVSEGRGLLSSSRSIVIYCARRPLQADIADINTTLTQVTGKKRKRWSKPTVLICYYAEDLFGDRKSRLEGDAGIALCEISSEEVYLDVTVISPIKDYASHILACISDLQASDHLPKL